MSSRSVVKGFIFFTHLRNFSVKIELISRDNNAKNSFNYFLNDYKVTQQCTMSFAFELTSVTRKIGHPLSANSINIFSTNLSLILHGLFIENDFFSKSGPMNHHCLLRIFLSNKNMCPAFANHFLFIDSCSTANVIEH